MANQAEPMDAVAAPANEERGNNVSELPAPSSAFISSEADLIAFTRLPLEERVLTAQLRGVLAESALTGRIRYKWPLLRPLVDFVLEQVLTAYDAETRVEVGPPGPDSVSETIERFQKLLSAFSDAPWTFQRLCEILLEPKRQYARLPKLVLAIEKCLLVTTEQPPTEPDQLPPPPLCSALGAVNTNPPPVYTNAHHGSHGGHGAGPSGGAEDSSGFTNSLIDVRHHPHHHHGHHGNHVGTPEHIEEDHWPEGLPEGKGAFKAAGVVGVVGLHGALRSGHGSGGGAAGHGSPGAGGGGGSGGGAAGASDLPHGSHGPSGGAPAVGPHTLLGALQHHGSPGATGSGGSPGGRRSSGGGSALPLLAADGPVAAAAPAAGPAGGAGGVDAMAVDSATLSGGISSHSEEAGRDAAPNSGEAPEAPAAGQPASQPRGAGDAAVPGPSSANEEGAGAPSEGATGAGTGAGEVTAAGDVEMEPVQETVLAPSAGDGSDAAGVESSERGGDEGAEVQAAQEATPAEAAITVEGDVAGGAASMGDAKDVSRGSGNAAAGSPPPGG